MTSSNGNIFRVTGHLCGEFTGLRWIPRTKASDAELWCFLWCARLSKHSRGWSFETLSHPLWRHRNDLWKTHFMNIISVSARFGTRHYTDVIMGAIASKVTSLRIVYSSVYSGADQRKHQSSASLAFVRGIHRDRWIPRTNGQKRGKCFHLMTSSTDSLSHQIYASVWVYIISI